MDSEGKHLARAALATIQDRGCTNLSGGLLEGLDVLEQREGSKNEISSVLLLTDGLANRGVTDVQQLLDITEKKVKGLRNPTSVYTFGYGGDHNSELLTGIATAGGGSYYYMRTTDSIPEAFADCMGGLMSVMAQNIKIEVCVTDPSSGVRIKDITTTFEQRVDTPGLATTVIIGDIFSEEHRDLLIDLYLPPSTSTTPSQPLINVNVRYFNVVSACKEEHTSIASIARTASESENGAISDSVQEQRSRIDTQKAMDEAQALADAGRLQEARGTLAVARDNIRASNSPWSVGSGGKQRLASKSRKHGMQRANHCDDRETTSAPTSSNMYMNASKGRMKSMFK